MTHWEATDTLPGHETQSDESAHSEAKSGETLRCSECGSSLSTSGDETYCTECGLVVDEDFIDRGPEWRKFQGEDATQTVRCNGGGFDPTHHDWGLGSEIGQSHSTSRLDRQRMYHNRSKIESNKDQTLHFAFGEVKRIISALSLPDAVNARACALFREVQEADLLTGEGIERYVAAAVYAACREYETPRLLEEIATVARLDSLPVVDGSDKEPRDFLLKSYKKLCSELDIHYRPMDPGLYLPKATSNLGMSQTVQNEARRLVEFAVENNFHVGRKPTGVAAGALYFASQRVGESVNQTTISDELNISPPTLRRNYEQFTERKDVPLPVTAAGDTGDKGLAENATGEVDTTDEELEEDALEAKTGDEPQVQSDTDEFDSVTDDVVDDSTKSRSSTVGSKKEPRATAATEDCATGCWPAYRDCGQSGGQSGASYN
jgi:transcription initiation factor TFIIB